jgi:hypothetical protein
MRSCASAARSGAGRPSALARISIAVMGLFCHGRGSVDTGKTAPDLARFSLPPVCHDTLLFGGFSRKGTVRNGLPPPGRTVEDHSENQRKAASRLGFF